MHTHLQVVATGLFFYGYSEVLAIKALNSVNLRTDPTALTREEPNLTSGGDEG